MDYIDIPLSTLFKVGSIDDDQGRPLFQMIGFALHPGSLESLATADSTTVAWNTRLTKVLNILRPFIGPLYVTGYSLSSINAIQLLLQARQNNDWWASQIEGILTLAGVNFGTQVSDCSIGEIVSSPPTLCIANTLELSTIINLSTELVPDINYFDSNTKLIAEALAVVAAAELTKPEIPEMEGLTPMFPDVEELWNDILEVLLFEVFDLKDPIGDYAGNIDRFKIAAAAINESTYSLITRLRTEWWATHTVPTDVKYFFVNDAQVDPTINVGPVCHTDTYLLREQFYQLNMMHGGYLNDAQVSSPLAMLLPPMHMSLNPKQQPYEAYWLGLTTSTHWGIALPYVLPDPDDWADPFPRAEFITSIATFVAMKL